MNLIGTSTHFNSLLLLADWYFGADLSIKNDLKQKTTFWLFFPKF